MAKLVAWLVKSYIEKEIKQIDPTFTLDVFLNATLMFLRLFWNDWKKQEKIQVNDNELMCRQFKTTVNSHCI